MIKVIADIGDTFKDVAIMALETVEITNSLVIIKFNKLKLKVNSKSTIEELELYHTLHLKYSAK